MQPTQDPNDLESGDGRFLLDADDAAWDEAKATTGAARLAVELDALCGGLGPVTPTADLGTAHELAAAIARARTGRARTIRVAELGQDASDVAACVVEPVDAEALHALRARADRDGFVLIADESRTVHRLAPGLACRELGVTPDLVVLGPSVAGGAEFGAVAGADSVGPVAAPDDRTAALAAATLARLRVAPVAGALGDIGARIREAFDAACRREKIDAELAGPPQLMRASFRGQEDAEGPLLELHFGYELERFGVRSARRQVVPSLAWHGDVLAALLSGVDRAVARMRCLLIEHNSWMCGEVPFVFPGADPEVADRGLAFYRFPKRAAVDLLPDPEREQFTIRFHGGPLGEVTSSGFYLPTLFTGDFDLRCAYRVVAWEPGPDSACFGLFAQNLASSHRYYAQRMSDGSAPDEHRVLGSHANIVHPAHPVRAPGGELRVSRTGRALTTWHRADGDAEWTALATDEAATADDVVFGAKIWAKIESGPIEVVIRDLRIDGRMASEQIPRLEHRPDPRGP